MNAEDPFRPVDRDAACERATQLAMDVLYGEADADARAELAAHLARCAACAALQGERSAAHAALEQCPPALALAALPRRTRAPRRKRIVRTLVAAALLLASAAAGVALLEARWRDARRVEREREDARFEARLAQELRAARSAWTAALRDALQAHGAAASELVGTFAAAQRGEITLLALQQREELSRVRAAIADLAAFAGYARSGD
jgi:hypothetical protein